MLVENLEELAKGLAEAVGVLAKRRSVTHSSKDESYRKYLVEVSRHYEALGYLPQIYPAFAINYTYYLPSKARKVSEALARVKEALGELAGDVDPRRPPDWAKLTTVGSVVLCMEASRGRHASAVFTIGNLRTGVAGYCSLIQHAHRSSLLVAANYYIYSALPFVLESLRDYVDRTRARACDGCSRQARNAGGIRGLWRFQLACPECYEAYRRELTSRTFSGYRALLGTILGVKWVYNALHIIGEDLDGVITPAQGVRRNYPVMPTYLGRLLGNAVEAWSGRIPDAGGVRGLAEAVSWYIELYQKFRVEALDIASRGRVQSMYTLRCVTDFLAKVRDAIREHPALALVVPLGTVDIVDDLVNYVVNERIHRTAAEYYAPETRDSFRWFEQIDIETLVIARTVRGK